MRTRLLFASVLLALGMAAPAYARGTLDSILPGLRAEHPGRLSDAQPWTDSDGRTHYRIKWLTPEGRIIYFDAEAESGRYRSTGGDGWRGGSHGGGRGEEGQSGEGGGGRSHFTGGESGDGDWTGGRGGWHDRGGEGQWHGGSGGGGEWHGGQGGRGGGHHHHGE